MAPENGVLHRSGVERLMVRPAAWMNFLKLLSVYLMIDQLVLHISDIFVLIIEDSVLLVFLINLILVLSVVNDVVSVERVVGEIDDLFASYYRLSVEANFRDRLVIERVVQFPIDFLSYRLVYLRVTAIKPNAGVLGVRILGVVLNRVLLAFHRRWLLSWKSTVSSTC